MDNTTNPATAQAAHHRSFRAEPGFGQPPTSRQGAGPVAARRPDAAQARQERRFHQAGGKPAGRPPT